MIKPERFETWHFGDIVADPNRLEVRREGQITELEPKALRVLFYLLENRDRVVSKDELIQEVWAGTAVTDNALTRVIAQIRKQLGDDARSPRYIQTAASAGYRFIAEIRTTPPAPLVFAPSKDLIPRQSRRWRFPMVVRHFGKIVRLGRTDGSNMHSLQGILPLSRLEKSKGS